MDRADLVKFNELTGTDTDINLSDLNVHLELGLALLDGQLVDLKKAGMLEKSKKAELVIDTTRDLILMQIIGIDLITERMQALEFAMSDLKQNGFK